MSQLFNKFSSKENLKKAYSYVQNELAHSSLSVNPINHPSTTAVNDLGDDFFVALEQYLRSGEYKPEKGFFVYIPKDNLGLRPVCVLSMVDRIVYQAIFNQEVLGYKIDGQLSDKMCFANRINDDEKSEYFLSQYFNNWDSFCKEQKKAFKKGYTWKLEVDVQQYYEHIPAGKLLYKLKNDFGVKDEKILEILNEQLCTWAEYPELPKGIPQGPNPSAVIGNVYLSSLDTFAEEELVGKGLRYFRYADDITLMGKSKNDVLRATEKIVHFLREHNLSLNEKTRLTEIEDVETIEAMRFFSDYEDNTPEIPEDDFTLVQDNIPSTIASIYNGEKVEKSSISELKYFLKVDTGYSFDLIMKLIGIIPLRPSLVAPIIQYVGEGRDMLSIFGDSMDAPLIDFTLWETYKREDISEWAKFWVFKLLVSNKDILIGDIDEEVEKILSSRQNTIFKIVCFYYQAIQENEIDIEQIKQAISGSETDVEKSLYSFFLLNAFQGARVPVIKSCLEKLLNEKSHELNLIGSFLFKNNKKASVDDFDGIFSHCLLKKKPNKKTKTKEIGIIAQQDFYMVRADNLIPIVSPPSILGVNRQQKKKGSIELVFPEIVQWEKVTLKIKEGMQDVEIFYDGTLIETADYRQLGFFTGKKQEKPDRQWGFLCALSALSATDITQATADKMCKMVAINSHATLSVGNVHQIKRSFVKRLRQLFNTGDDPFYYNRFYYQPKFTILPEPILRQKEVWLQGGKLNENIDYEEDDLL